MSLFSFLKPKPQAPAGESFLAVLLVDGIAQVMIWQVAEGKITVGASSDRISWDSEDSCLAAVDQGLQQLGRVVDQVHQTLFALSTDWVNAYGITAARKPLFQRLSKDLSLQPVGFVVITEAIVQYLLEIQGAPLHGFLIEVAATDMVVALVKNGKLGQVERVGKSDSPISDFTEALARFQDPTLPAKFVLFSAVLTDQETEEIRQKLFEQDWKSTHAFQQTPVIEVLAESKLAEAIVLTGGRAYAEQKHLLPTGTFTAQQHQPAEKPSHMATAAMVSDSMALAEIPSAESNIEEAELVPIDDTAVLHQTPHRPVGKFVAIGVILGLFVLAASTFVFAQTMMKADLLLQLDHKTLAKDVTLTLDPAASASDVSQLLLKANLVTQEASGELATPATGKKIIGDKAKGTVTIFNRTASDKTFDAGTKLSNGKFIYLTDSAVTIASASTGSNFQTNPGTKEVAVTAQDIGPESNLAKDKDLNIESFSIDTYVARTSTDLAGGSSREILAVSQVDRDKLLTELKRTLADQAYQDLKSQAASGMYIVPTNQVKVSQASYSAEVGKETNTVSLNMTLSAQALQYQVSDLQPFAEQLLSQDVPAQYKLDPESVQLLSTPQEASSSSAAVKLDANISGTAVPELDIHELKEQLLGKDASAAQQQIRQITGVKSFTLTRTPSWLEMINPKLPTKAELFTVAVAGDK